MFPISLCKIIICHNFFATSLLYSLRLHLFDQKSPVFSVTWSFGNHSNMLISCSRNISYYYQWWKQFQKTVKSTARDMWLKLFACTHASVCVHKLKDCFLCVDPGVVMVFTGMLWNWIGCTAGWNSANSCSFITPLFTLSICTGQSYDTAPPKGRKLLLLLLITEPYRALEIVLLDTFKCNASLIYKIFHFKTKTLSWVQRIAFMEIQLPIAHLKLLYKQMNT